MGQRVIPLRKFSWGQFGCHLRVLRTWFGRLKTLFPVKFTQYTSSAGPGSISSEGLMKEDTETMCPSCKKRLSNNILLFRAFSFFLFRASVVLHVPLVSKSCGHVICKTCTDTLVRPAKQCLVCEMVVKEKDIIELKREGCLFFIYYVIHRGD